MKHKLRREKGLLWQMIAAMVAVLVPLGLVISLLFAQSSNVMKKNWDSTQKNNTRIISGRIDDYVQGVYSASDAFATDPRMQEKVDTVYKQRSQKLLAMRYIKNNLFAGYNLLQDNPQISVIYHTGNGQIFNLLDPSQDETIVRQVLEELGVNEPEKLGKFCWYPLQDNQFQSNPYWEIRKDRVVVGSRRIYQSAKMQYPYVHIFAIQEKKLYDLYAGIAAEAQVEVYLLDENNNLLSSTQEFAVASGQPPEYVEQWVNMDTDESMIAFGDTAHTFYRWKSTLNGWTTVLVAPRSVILTQMQVLYTKVLWVLAIGVAAGIWSIARLYYRFTAPLSKVAKAMQQVDKGDWNAYVSPSGGQQISDMMETYNHMLESLNRNFDARLELEQKEKELEMQVLMTQINPHFLYNTLETIVWKAGEAGRPDIGRMAASLGKLYRLSISGGMTVPLRQELSHLQAYMNIQQTRCPNQIQYVKKVSEELLDSSMILKLSLQPVVENSILYAMDGLERPMTIRIKAHMRKNCLMVWITDNGKGMGKEQLEQLRQRVQSANQPPPDPQKRRRSTGIGLWNIVQRMKMHLGSEATFAVYSKEGWGTCIKMVFPQNPTIS